MSRAHQWYLAVWQHARNKTLSKAIIKLFLKAFRKALIFSGKIGKNFPFKMETWNMEWLWRLWKVQKVEFFLLLSWKHSGKNFQKFLIFPKFFSKSVMVRQWQWSGNKSILVRNSFYLCILQLVEQHHIFSKILRVSSSKELNCLTCLKMRQSAKTL